MKNQSSAGSSSAKTILFWGAVAAVIAVVFSVLLGLLIVKEIIPQKTAEYITPVIAMISVFIAGLCAAKSSSGKRMLYALGTAAVYFILCLLCKLAFFPGSTVFMLRNAIAILISALAAALISGMEKKRKRYTVPKRR